MFMLSSQPTEELHFLGMLVLLMLVIHGPRIISRLVGRYLGPGPLVPSPHWGSLGPLVQCGLEGLNCPSTPLYLLLGVGLLLNLHNPIHSICLQDHQMPTVINHTFKVHHLLVLKIPIHLMVIIILVMGFLGLIAVSRLMPLLSRHLVGVVLCNPHR